MELKQGTLLQGGKYKIEATLGGGSFGITYLATARFITQGGLGAMEVETKVAIKEFFMHEVNVRDRDGRSVEGSSSSVFTNYRHRFRREAKNLAKLRHPNIIRVYDVFDENGTTYYSMAYVEGTTLDEYIRLHHPLAEADAVAIFGRVCSALSSMHEQRMLHLDLKPKNIMRSTQGEVFLIDFGLSKQFCTNGEPESSTTIGAGTPGYAPIEQANPIKDGTFPATLDIYALGATMYKTLTGQRPPVATDVLNEGFPLEPLVQHRRSESLIKVIARCMSPMKKDRYQTVAELLRDYPALDEVEEETEATIFDSDSHGQKTVVQHCLNAQCGKEIPAGARFCPYCGTAVAKPGRVPAANTLEFTVNGVTFTMVRVEGGTFTMGSTSEQVDAYYDGKPAHQVTLSDYYIGQTVVTQALWKAVMGATPTTDGDQWTDERGLGDNYPAYYISYEDVQTFIARLNSLTGHTFRMPTEAEWEYAARGGSKSKGYLYSGGNTLDSVGWYFENSKEPKLKSHPVAQKTANELGLYDMSGNVWEWCSDRYDDYSSSPQTNPKGRSSESFRVLRGGSWRSSATNCRVANRYGATPTNRYNSYGVRLASDSDVQPVKHPTGGAPVTPPIVEKKVSVKSNPKKAEPIIDPKVIEALATSLPPLKKPSTRNDLLWSVNDTLRSVMAGLLMVLLVVGAIVIRCADNHTVVDIPRPAGQYLDITANGVTFTMVRVEGGTFTMGSTSEQTGAYDRETPAHQVTLSDYYIGQTEVTQALWKAVMGATPTTDGNQWTKTRGLGDNYPAYNISYRDVQAFIARLNKLTGRTFRMPTEAEWEYAARGGSKSKGYLYSGGYTLDNVGWYWDNRKELKSHPVSQKTANELGLYDMSGNVQEWCSDWCDDYSPSPQTNPKGSTSGYGRVLRGGGWCDDASDCRVAARFKNPPTSRSFNFGVRLASDSSL